jgi:invasion protein IalB
MDYRIASARPMSRALTVAVAATVLSLFVSATALAQQPAAPAAPAKPPVAKPAPKPAAPAQKPAEQPQQPQQQQQQAGQQQQEVPPLMYSPWMKVCGKGQDAGAKQVCVTAKDGRVESGMPIVIVSLIEPEGEPRKLIRVTLPPGLLLPPGTRLIIDQGQPQSAPYITCTPNGCIADYPADADTVTKLKKGQTVFVQAMNINNVPISLPLPLSDFAKAYDGPPQDPKVFEEQQRKLQEELQKKAEEARKKLESQQQPAGAAPTPAAPKQ